MDAIGLHARIMVAMGTAAPALRDEGALESALMRPQMAAHYESADLATQAALLIIGIALAHPFVDGNKRTAFLCGVSCIRHRCDRNMYPLLALPQSR